MKVPFISCKCITYGRVNLLEEAIASFLKQDYPKDRCELIIVNDYPLQTLIYNHANIKIFNLDKTFPTIGEKENFAIEQCQGEIIAVWDDDDIALSNHLSNIAKFWRKDANLLHWQKGAFYNEPEITKLMSIGNSGIAYSKKAWETIGKSPIENAGGDMTMVIKMHNLGRDKVILADPPDEEVSWFYRWGMSSENLYHQSGQGTDEPGRPNIIQRHSIHIENLRMRGLIPIGNIELLPEWKHPYDLMLINYIKKHASRN
jgi:glycosyltransferase involved in cell wall biosynthesis